MFDETFMKHQVAEHTIKSQLTVEIFVNKGLDSALNIDRETFNVSHPHYQIVMRWLHQAIRQVVNKYKVIKRDLTVVSRREGQSDFLRNLSQVVDEGLLVNGVDPAEKASLHIVDEDSRDGTEIPVDSFRISTKDYKNITAFNSTGSLKSHKVEARSEALLQLLDGYGLLKELSPKQQHNLIVDILKVMSVED
jgi:hypothetical protein